MGNRSSGQHQGDIGRFCPLQWGRVRNREKHRLLLIWNFSLSVILIFNPTPSRLRMICEAQAGKNITTLGNREAFTSTELNPQDSVQVENTTQYHTTDLWVDKGGIKLNKWEKWQRNTGIPSFIPRRNSLWYNNAADMHESVGSKTGCTKSRQRIE